jgi:hypothetical protein
MMEIQKPPTERTFGDLMHSTGKAVFGVIPVAGPAITEIFEMVVAAPIEKRRSAWFEMITESINFLLETVEDLTPDLLSKNEAFISAVIATTNSALKTERQEKLKLLQAAVQKIGGGVVLDEVMRNTFLSILDRYTPEYVLLLRKLGDETSQNQAIAKLRKDYPAKVKSSDIDGPYLKVEDLALAIFDGQRSEVIDELFSDLHRDRLCHGSEGFAYTVFLTKERVIVTERGRQFLNFIDPSLSLNRT